MNSAGMVICNATHLAPKNKYRTNTKSKTCFWCTGLGDYFTTFIVPVYKTRCDWLNVAHSCRYMIPELEQRVTSGIVPNQSATILDILQGHWHRTNTQQVDPKVSYLWFGMLYGLPATMSIFLLWCQPLLGWALQSVSDQELGRNHRSPSGIVTVRKCKCHSIWIRKGLPFHIIIVPIHIVVQVPPIVGLFNLILWPQLAKK